MAKVRRFVPKDQIKDMGEDELYYLKGVINILTMSWKAKLFMLPSSEEHSFSLSDDGMTTLSYDMDSKNMFKNSSRQDSEDSLV